jgi:hypothetical protein
MIILGKQSEIAHTKGVDNHPGFSSRYKGVTTTVPKLNRINKRKIGGFSRQDLFKSRSNDYREKTFYNVDLVRL